MSDGRHIYEIDNPVEIGGTLELAGYVYRIENLFRYRNEYFEGKPVYLANARCVKTRRGGFRFRFIVKGDENA